MDAAALTHLAARLAAARAAEAARAPGHPTLGPPTPGPTPGPTPEPNPGPTATSRRAAVAAALRESEAGLEVLLMRRAAREGDRWSGQISLPGGHIEATDPDEVAAAVRETHEEVGLDLAADASVIGAMAPLQAMARGRRVDLWITPVVFHYRGRGQLALGPEADDAFWLPLGAAGRGELDARYPYVHEGVELLLPSWRYGERVVWGLTHKILTQLVGTLG